MRKILVFITFNIFLNSISAQTRFFKGQVVSENGKAISYATVNFSNSSSPKIIITKITSDDGSFILNADSLKGSYIISISHLSFKTLKQEVDFTNLSEDIHIFSLVEKIQKMKEIKIIARSQVIYRKRDKVIMDVQNNALAVGQNLYNLLQMAPGVIVMNKQIFLNGESGTRIYINDKPLLLSGISLQNYLNSLQASNIKSIEITAHPSAENDAEGTGGIINIILKKPSIMGISGYLGHDQNFGLGKFPTYNPYVSINLKTNKLQLSVGYAFLNQKDFFHMTQIRSLANNGIQTLITDEIQKTNNNDANITVSYDLTNKQNISVYYFSSLSKYNATTSGATKNNYSNNVNDMFSHGNFPSRTNNIFYNTGFNYEWITDTLKSKFLIIGDYTFRNSDACSKINSKTYNYTNQLIGDTVYNYMFPNISKIYTLDVRYKKNYKSGTELILGGKMALTDISTRNLFEIFKDGIWVSPTENDFNYSYRENVNALFLVLSGKFLSVDYKVGIRTENSHIKGLLNGSFQDSIYTQKYFDLFPSFFIGKVLDKTGNHYLSLSYNKRIGRPVYSLLNPYKYYTGNYSVTSGNPYLEPSYTDVIELGYTLQNKYHFGLAQTYIKNQINRISKIDPFSSIINYLPENIGHSVISKLTITAPLRITKWWRTNNSLLILYVKTTSAEFRIQRGTFTLQNNNEFSLGKSTSMNLSAYYNLRAIYGNTISKPFSNISIGIRQRLFKDKLIISADIWDLFYSNNPEMISYYNNTQILIDKKYQTRLLMFSLVYNFNLGKIFKTKPVEKSNEDEKSRLQKF